MRIFGPGATSSQDLEPEYVAVSRTSRRAWVTLQENNAIAIVDLRKAQVHDIAPLGTIDHAVPGSGIDASDEDGGVPISPRPVQGMAMPDSIDAFTGGGNSGRTFLVTADEGDAREYDCFEEEAGVADLELDPAVFPGAEELQKGAALGRLTVTTTSPRGRNGYTSLRSFGTQSLQVRDAAGRLVWDSGSLIERVTAVGARDLQRGQLRERRRRPQ